MQPILPCKRQLEHVRIRELLQPATWRGGMELRVLRYFLTVATEGSFTAASCKLNVTQPTLSRQIQELEAELGSILLIRGKRKASLTVEGTVFAQRAAEILELAARARAEVGGERRDIYGDVNIGAGETEGMRLIASAAKKLRRKYPGIHFHIFSGNAEEVAGRLDAGLVDFGLFIRPANLENYEYAKLPATNIWGLLTRKDDPIAASEFVTPGDLAGMDLICSRQPLVANELAGWMGGGGSLKVVATYNLLYNAAIMVQEGMGRALCLAGIANVSPASDLRFLPLKPTLEVGIDLAWKKGRIFSAAPAAFRACLLKEIHD